MNKILCWIAGMVILASCSNKITFRNPNPNKFNLNNVEYEYISMRSKVKYDDGDKRQKAVANIRLKKDSILWFSITPGMGIEAARGVITANEFIIVDRIHKTYTRRPIREFSEKAHFELDLSLIESILVGNMVWPVEKRSEISKQKEYYVVTKAKGDLKVENFIGSHTMKLEKIHATSDTSSSTLDIKYADFDKFSSRIMPTNIEAKISYTIGTKTQKMSNITIEHTKVEIDDSSLSFPFSIPSKYKAL